MTTPDQWICVNVGVDGADVMAKELSVVWLLVDIFSNYHVDEVSKFATFSISTPLPHWRPCLRKFQLFLRVVDVCGFDT